MQPYSPILSVYIVWHPDADTLCRPLATALYVCLNRDPDKPFAHGIGIPAYFRCAPESGANLPLAIDLNAAEHTVIFALVDDHMVLDETWANYLAGLYSQAQASTGKHLLVPVALTGSGFNLHPDIAKINFVRLFNLDPAAFKTHLIHYAAHALARLLENSQRITTQGAALSPLPIKLFISHTKREANALQLAEALKQALDDTQMDRFFDSVDIAAGHHFADEIEGNIENAALIAIRSDRYSDSPWCRMEVMTAKRLNRPMIVVDILRHHEDRSFPYLSNVPVMRFEPDTSLTAPETQNKLQAIIDFALLEVLRFIYIKRHFEHLKTMGWLPRDALILARPPEERDLKNQPAKQIVYPDPPLGYEENSELSQYQIPLFTPTTLRGEPLQGLAIGISISDTDPGELQALGLSGAHLKNAMVEIACHCLAQGATLIYGGDLRPNGFTEDLLELVRYHNDALKKQIKPVINYLAWPLIPTLDMAWAAQHKDALKIKKVDAPADLKQTGLIPEIPQGGDIGDISAYVWARCLTAMREQIVANTQARILLGGRTVDYKGKYPGLVEEALLTLKAKKPLFLLGGYGGAARIIIQALRGGKPRQLTEAYQCTNPGYKILLEEFNGQIKSQQLALDSIDYSAVVETFAEIGISGLNNGLSDQENLRLFATVNHEEAIGLILMGLARLKSTI
ncbi:TIR domain-containing protein [Methylomonas montana]|uniref:TIR domain-containing protein n=1 Tax=Methylomonas montana TaxID=3058963 RepID=UPI0026596621|nr:TIR domain-containing protein [Methylomonas montana]WKJ92085.1 TIR domain-containing protein [Methylomonas montana]